MKRLLLFLTCIVLNACVEEEDLNRSRVVVESYLIVGQTPTVKVTTLALFESSEEAQPVEGLDIAIESDGTTYSLSASSPGLYENNDLVVLEGQDYNLSFIHGGRNITSVARALHKPKEFKLSTSSITIEGAGGGFPPSVADPVKMYWENPESDYYVVVVENMESNPQSINNFSGNRPSFNFRNTPTNASTQDIGARQFQYYGMHRIILFHITPDYAALYNETGNTSQNITTPPTNIENGLGIFTAVNSDTLFLRVK